MPYFNAGALHYLSICSSSGRLKQYNIAFQLRIKIVNGPHREHFVITRHNLYPSFLWSLVRYGKRIRDFVYFPNLENRKSATGAASKGPLLLIIRLF